MILAPHAIKRLIEPDEVAGVVAFLAGDSGAAFTGRAGDHGYGLDRSLSACVALAGAGGVGRGLGAVDGRGLYGEGCGWVRRSVHNVGRIAVPVTPSRR